MRTGDISAMYIGTTSDDAPMVLAGGQIPLVRSQPGSQVVSSVSSSGVGSSAKP